MNREQKELVVQLLKQDFQQNQAAFIVKYKGLTVTQMQKLRSELKKSGGKFKIAKARLLKLAAEDVGANQLVPYFKDQIGVVFTLAQAPAVAKTLHEFSKSNELFSIIAGQLDGSKLLDKSAIVRISSLPSKEVLLAQLCGTLNAPITNMARVLYVLLARLVIVLKQIEESKKKQS